MITRPPVPIVELVRNEVASAASGEWILVLDPDEQVTPGLAQELRRLAGRTDLGCHRNPTDELRLGLPTDQPGAAV